MILQCETHIDAKKLLDDARIKISHYCGDNKKFFMWLDDSTYYVINADDFIRAIQNATNHNINYNEDTK